MKTRLLTPAEFKATFGAPMRDVTTATTDVVDIWPYVHAVPPTDLSGHILQDGFVDRVYRNSGGTYDHVLVLTKTTNVFLAVVVDLAASAVFGHHLLDLNREYGLVKRH